MTTSGQLFNYLQPVMNTMIDMMGLYHNYPNIVELFLEIYCEAAKRMLCYLTTSASRHLYQQTINLIQVYAHHNQVMVYLYTAKVQILWEGQKNFRKPSRLFWNYKVKSKQSGYFFQIFVAFSKYLNWTNSWRTTVYYKEKDSLRIGIPLQI